MTTARVFPRCAQDAQHLAQILQEQYSYDTDLLVDNVTGSWLKALLNQELPAKITHENDRLIFYFAGHGLALEGDGGPAGYLVPQDADAGDRDTFLPMQMIHDALAALPCRHCLIILDCCFSGAFRWASTRSLIKPVGTMYRERYERFLRSPAWQVLTSAAYDQEALDSLTGSGFGSREAEGQQHSPFAQALFQALAGQADANDDGILVATELYLYLRDHVEVEAEAEAQHYQTPGLWPLSKHDKGEYIFVLGELNLPPAPEPTPENNPYRGLQSFDEEHAPLFFGRTTLIRGLATVVTKQPLTVVLGASGTGKSSLVKAGLVPFLKSPVMEAEEQNKETHPEEETGAWEILPPLRPTDSPLTALFNHLKSNLSDAAQTLTLSEMRHNPAVLAHLIKTWAEDHPHQNLLLVIDQFEELVTLCRDDDERRQFLKLLLEVLQTTAEHFRLILTLRSDFEPQLDSLDLKQFWNNDTRFVVPPLSQAELREAIEGPAGVAVLYFEPPELVDDLINDVAQTPGALPLLSFTLSELYMRYLARYLKGETEDRALIEADYKALGGVIGSLRNRAGEEYNNFDKAHRATMRRLMLRMIAVEGGELARRRVPRSELIYPDETENERVDTVLNRLVEARLLVSGDADGEAYVEPAHDALVRAWDKLLVWQRQEEETLPLQRRLTQAANDWDAANPEKQKDLLWHNDAQLGQVEQVMENRSGQNGSRLGFVRRGWRVVRPSPEILTGTTWLNRRETEFVQQSLFTRARNVRVLVEVVAVVVAILATAAIFTNNQRISAVASEGRAVKSQETAVASEATAVKDREVAVTAEAKAEVQRKAAVSAEATAVAERDIALSRQLAAQSNTLFDDNNDQLALLLAIEAGRKANTLEAFTTIHQALSRLAKPRFAMQHDGVVYEAQWNGDESLILTRSEDNTARLWETDLY